MWLLALLFKPKVVVVVVSFQSDTVRVLVIFFLFWGHTQGLVVIDSVLTLYQCPASTLGVHS